MIVIGPGTPLVAVVPVEDESSRIDREDQADAEEARRHPLGFSGRSARGARPYRAMTYAIEFGPVRKDRPVERSGLWGVVSRVSAIRRQLQERHDDPTISVYRRR